MEITRKKTYNCIWYTYELLLASDAFLSQSRDSSTKRLCTEELPLFLQLQKDTIHDKDDDTTDYVCVPILHHSKKGLRIYVDFKRPNTVIDGGGVYPNATKIDNERIRLPLDSPIAVGDSIFVDMFTHHVTDIIHEDDHIVAIVDGHVTDFKHCGWYIEEPDKPSASIIAAILHNYNIMCHPAPTQILGVGGLFQEDQHMLFFNRARVTCVVDGRTHLIVDRHFYDQRWLGGEPVHLCMIQPDDSDYITHRRHYPVGKDMDRYEIVYRRHPIGWSVYLGQYLGNTVDQDKPRCSIFVEPGVLLGSI